MTDRDRIEKTYIAEEGMTDLWNVWYSELHNGQSGLTIKVDRIIESVQSEFQRIDVLQTHDFGKMLVLYGSLMVCDNDNNAYNEMIVHVPLFCHPSPKRVLIIGGGDCGALTEVMKHPEVESCTMCELDEKVVQVARRHFPELCTGLEDSRSRLIFQDGKKFLETTRDKFDIIILDLSDPVGPAADLFQKEFHQSVHDRLNHDGILVAQTESPFYNQDTVKSIYSNLTQIFPLVRMYTCFMPIYPSGFWSFGFCSNKYDPLADFDEARCLERGLATKYYNADVHRGAFCLPQFVKDLLA
ncbi:MAG: polyamine aminopropyltransferase [candidate division Zixibacteria bacterium]|nr:polyamine aminopropyltransferase [candidate division Zixibacteria bacterium]MDH3936997.1 polyamine aminopropyltransferase [candidate division Zixibacteria bacterium]